MFWFIYMKILKSVGFLTKILQNNRYRFSSIPGVIYYTHRDHLGTSK